MPHEAKRACERRANRRGGGRADPSIFCNGLSGQGNPRVARRDASFRSKLRGGGNALAFYCCGRVMKGVNGDLNNVALLTVRL